MWSESEIIDELVAIRRERGLRVCDVARQLGVVPAAITRFERGYYSPTLQHILRYANVVGAEIRIDTSGH